MSKLGYIDFDDMGYDLVQLTQPWGCHVAPNQMLALFVLKRGSAWLQTDSDFMPCVQLSEGDIVGVSSGIGYTISSAPDIPVNKVIDVTYINQSAQPIIRNNIHNNENGSEILIGRVPTTKNNITGIYPVASIIRPEDGDRYKRILFLIELISREYMESPSPSSPAIIKRLTEVLAIELLENAEQKRAEGEVAYRFASTANRHVSKALDLLHEDFQKDWTLESLARAVGCSRSVFAESFRTITGATAMAYLTSLRINRAITLIEGGATSLSEVAYMVGYQSEAGFSRAFLREIGVTPGCFRSTLKKAGNA